MGGVAIMAGAALMTKVIGVFQKIPLQNLAGDRVFGLYNAVYPFYQLVVVLATAGLPTAVSLIIAERLRSGGGSAGTRRILQAAMLVLGVTGIGAFALMWASAEWTAGLIGDTGAAGAIRAVSVAILVAPLVAALRGYAQGHGEMQLSAVSQIAEQFVRVAVMVGVLIASLSAGWLDEDIAAGVMSGSAMGAFAALLLLGVLLWRGRERSGKRGLSSSGKRELGNSALNRGKRELGNRAVNSERRESGKSAVNSGKWRVGNSAVNKVEELDRTGSDAVQGSEGEHYAEPVRRPLLSEIRNLVAVALPVAIGAVVVPLLGVVDSFTVPRLLRNEGLTEPEAMALFGIYSRAQPLVQLVVMVAGAAAAALVPGLALARMRRAYGQLRMQLSLIVRAAWALGAAAALGLALLAEPMNVMLYADAEGTRLFALVGLSALAGCVNAVNAPVLQALRSMRASVALVLLAAALKGVLNAVLVPAIGAEGAALAGLLALGVSALLGTLAISRAAAASGVVSGARRGSGNEPGESERTLSESESVLRESEGKGNGGASLVRESERTLSGNESELRRSEGTGSGSENVLRRNERAVSGSESMLRKSERALSSSENLLRKSKSALRDGSQAERTKRGGRWSALAQWRPAASAVVALAAMTAALMLAEQALGAPLGSWLPPRAAAAALALTGTAVGACVFGAAALRGGVVGAREWRALPGGGVWAARLRRWRLIPPAE
jgi:O-antigen/teichoic acid export membrane protein